MGDIEAEFATNAARGDDEAADRWARRTLEGFLDQTAPDAVRYRREATACVLSAAKALGLAARPTQTVAGLNVLVAGSVIGVDIRTGTHFELLSVTERYTSLLDIRLALVDAILTIVRWAPDSTAIHELRSLQLPGRNHAVG